MYGIIADILEDKTYKKKRWWQFFYKYNPIKISGDYVLFFAEEKTNAINYFKSQNIKFVFSKKLDNFNNFNFAPNTELILNHAKSHGINLAINKILFQKEILEYIDREIIFTLCKNFKEIGVKTRAGAMAQSFSDELYNNIGVNLEINNKNFESDYKIQEYKLYYKDKEIKPKIKIDAPPIEISEEAMIFFSLN
jgi:hypothetical protein